MKKRIATAILTLAMLCTMLPAALAAGVTITTDKETYMVGTPMVITVAGDYPEGSVVLIYEEDANIYQDEAWTGVYALDAEGRWMVDAPNRPGNFQVRLYADHPGNLADPASGLLAVKNFIVNYTGAAAPTSPTVPAAPTTPDAPGATAGLIATDKPAYTLTEPMVVSLSGGYPEGSVVLIYKEDANIYQDEAWTGVYALDAKGRWMVDAPNRPGNFQVRLYADHPGNLADPASGLLAVKDFIVAYNTTGTPKVAVDKANYTAGEQMTVTVSGLSQVQIGWAAVGVYGANATIYQAEAETGAYALDAKGQWKLTAPTEAGVYQVRLYGEHPTNAVPDAAAALLAQAVFTVGGAALPNQPVNGSVTPGQNGVSNWAIPEINNAIQEGLVTDKVTVDFSRPITREEFCELAVKLYEAISGNAAPAAPANTFTDTQNPEILKAFQLKIVNGTGQGLFSPGNPISRQEIATMLLRTVKAAVPQLNTDTASAPAFVDSGDIADWAREGVNYFASKEIIKGANGAFMPKANTTCEAAIALVKRTFDSFTAI